MVQLQILAVIWLRLGKRWKDIPTKIVSKYVWEKFDWLIVDFSVRPAGRRVEHLRKSDADRPNTTKNKYTGEKQNDALLG